MTYAEINKATRPPADYVLCVECGSYRPKARLKPRADGGLYCAEAEYCARAKRVRAEVEALFRAKSGASLVDQRGQPEEGEYLEGLSVTLAESSPEALAAHRRKWSEIRKARRRAAKRGRACPVCGRDMSGNRANAKVCSRKCKERRRWK